MNSKDINQKGQRQEATNQKEQFGDAQASRGADLKGQDKYQSSKDQNLQAQAGQAGEQVWAQKGAQAQDVSSRKDNIAGQANLGSQKEQSSQARNENVGQQFDAGKAGQSQLQGTQQYQKADQQLASHKEHAGRTWESTHLGAQDDGVHGQTFIPEEHQSKAGLAGQSAGLAGQSTAGLAGQSAGLAGQSTAGLAGQSAGLAQGQQCQTGASANKVSQEQCAGSKGDQQKQGKQASEKK